VRREGTKRRTPVRRIHNKPAELARDLFGNAECLRVGGDGEHEQSNLDTSREALAWNVGDMASAASREDVGKAVDAACPDDLRWPLGESLREGVGLP